jgi:hypothetical protein
MLECFLSALAARVEFPPFFAALAAAQLARVNSLGTTDAARKMDKWGKSKMAE